jgi:uncharacterized protein (DUF305 family)
VNRLFYASLPTVRRGILFLLVVVNCIPGLSVQAAAQATPTALDICAPYDLTQGGTPEAAAGTPAAVDVTALEFDLLFLDAMIPHHQMAVEMAMVARERAEHPELREFADNVISVQQAEIDTMREWRESWYSYVPPLTEQQLIDGMTAKLSDSPGVGAPAGVDEMGMEHMVADMTELCATADDFDLAFIDLMLGHHSSAIVLGQEAFNRAVHPETREMGSTIAIAQQFEVDQMLTWRELWYPGAPITGGHDH